MFLLSFLEKPSMDKTIRPDCKSACHPILQSNNPIENFRTTITQNLVFVKDFLWTMDRDRNGQDGRNGQEWTAEWTMDDGRWTEIMSRPYRADSNIADPTNPTDPASCLLQ